jgi:hypothetical protein
LTPRNFHVQIKSMMRKTIAEALPLVRRRMGLIIGPSATTTPSFLSALNSGMAARFLKGQPPKASFVDTGEAILDANVPEAEVRAFIRAGAGAWKHGAPSLRGQSWGG